MSKTVLYPLLAEATKGACLGHGWRREVKEKRNLGDRMRLLCGVLTASLEVNCRGGGGIDRF